MAFGQALLFYFFCTAFAAGTMDDSDVEMAERPSSYGGLEDIRRKKFKTSELPASASQRAAVDSLLYSFKKKGGFDLERKQIWGEFNCSVRSPGVWQL